MDSSKKANSEEVWLHRFALLAAAATFPLLFIGGLVTSKGAGLAVPDWPTTFGYNMFLYPWSRMVGGMFYEHSHRLVASLVGLLTVTLALWMWKRERREWLRWLGVTALALVVVQGIVGGLRVVLVEEALAVIHACLAQAFFALMVTLAFFTSEEGKRTIEKVEERSAERLQRLAVLTTGIIYVQGFFGALLRYTGGRLDAHLFFAALVAFQVIFLGTRVWKLYSDQPKLARPAGLLAGLLFLQLALGFGSYLGRFTSFEMAPVAAEIIRTSHVVVGALMLATSLALTLRSYKTPVTSGSFSGGRVLSRRLSS